MISIIDLQGNNIFEIARRFERLALSELGDIDEAIPPELRFLDQNTIENTSTINSFKKFQTKFNDLFGIIKSYEYKNDINTNSRTTKNITSEEQLLNTITTQRITNLVKLDEYMARLTDIFKYSQPLKGTPKDLNARYTIIDRELTKELSELNKLDNIDNYIFRELTIEKMRFFVSNDTGISAPALAIKENLMQRASYIERENNDIMKTMIDIINKENQNVPLETLLKQQEASSVINELNTLKDAIPITKLLIDSLRSNINEWNDLINSGNINLTKSKKDFTFKIQDDSYEMVEIIEVKPKKQFDTYIQAKKLLIELDQIVQGLGSPVAIQKFNIPAVVSGPPVVGIKMAKKEEEKEEEKEAEKQAVANAMAKIIAVRAKTKAKKATNTTSGKTKTGKTKATETKAEDVDIDFNSPLRLEK